MVESLPLCCCVTRATQGEKVEDGIKAAPEKVFCPIKLRRNSVADEMEWTEQDQNLSQHNKHLEHEVRRGPMLPRNQR